MTKRFCTNCERSDVWKFSGRTNVVSIRAGTVDQTDMNKSNDERFCR